ncbi:MAG: hypothetical protein Q8N77_03130 [Nanoarchaeota archaeon]|nr:hypothetical protein [Nanoarchaeota archaeon]
MKLNAIIIDSLDEKHLAKLSLEFEVVDGSVEMDEENFESYNRYMCEKTTELERLTKGQYFCGQDDGKDFFAVEKKHSPLLKGLFKEFEITEIESRDYPWDHWPCM